MDCQPALFFYAGVFVDVVSRHREKSIIEGVAVPLLAKLAVLDPGRNDRLWFFLCADHL